MGCIAMNQFTRSDAWLQIGSHSCCIALRYLTVPVEIIEFCMQQIHKIPMNSQYDMRATYIWHTETYIQKCTNMYIHQRSCMYLMRKPSTYFSRLSHHTLLHCCIWITSTLPGTSEHFCSRIHCFLGWCTRRSPCAPARHCTRAEAVGCWLLLPHTLRNLVNFHHLGAGQNASVAVMSISATGKSWCWNMLEHAGTDHCVIFFHL